MVMLDNIFTTGELAVSFQTPGTEEHLKYWLPNCQSGLVKAKVHGTRTKQMVLAFFG